MASEITLRRPDDMHVHLRWGEMLRQVLPFTARVFGRGLVMGNNPDPVDSVDRVRAYRTEIHEADSSFTPIMSVMLTARSANPKVIRELHRIGVNHVKFIPGKSSTGSAGTLDLTDLPELKDTLETIRELGMYFLVHLELTSKDGLSVPILKQEREAIPFADWIIKNVPGINLVVEHATTLEMIELVEKAPANVAATFTIHHPFIGYEDVCGKRGEIINPLIYCKPVAKKQEDRMAIARAMTSGNPKFFFGSDSAPHPLEKKQGSAPAAGIFSAPVALPLLCEYFELASAMDRLEDFVSLFGAKYYGLPLNEGRVIVRKEKWKVPAKQGNIAVFMGGETLDWKVVEGS